MYRRLVHLQSKNDTQRSSNRGCCFGICGRKAERVDDYEKKLENMEGNLRSERSSLAGKVKIVDCCLGFKIKFAFLVYLNY